VELVSSLFLVFTLSFILIHLLSFFFLLEEDLHSLHNLFSHIVYELVWCCVVFLHGDFSCFATLSHQVENYAQPNIHDTRVSIYLDILRKKLTLQGPVA
jgi:hypothetical protein